MKLHDLDPHVRACLLTTQEGALHGGHDANLIVFGPDIELFCGGLNRQANVTAMPRFHSGALTVLLSLARATRATLCVEVRMRPLDAGYPADGNLNAIAETDPDVYTAVAVADCAITPTATPTIWVSVLTADGWADPEPQPPGDNALTAQLSAACRAAGMLNLLGETVIGAPQFGTDQWGRALMFSVHANARDVSVVGMDEAGIAAASKVAEMAAGMGLSVDQRNLGEDS